MKHKNLFKVSNNNYRSENKQLEIAKNYPITKLYQGELKQVGSVLMGCCPFHREKTASFAIYPDTNTWNCFAGCGGGDSISFYMRLYDVDFKEAVEELNK